jgi:UDP-glucose 4-epimerase
MRTFLTPVVLVLERCNGMKKDKVIVTGGAGFIGSHLSHRLADLGYEVVMLDNLVRGRYQYIKNLVDDGKATFVEGDIKNPSLLRKTFKDAKYVFHEAAVCINYSLEHAEESIETNVNGSFNVFKAAAEAGAEKLIFASSASVYGNPVTLPMREDHSLSPITPYCVSKIAGEYFLRIFGPKGLKYNILRYFNVYGPRQNVDAYYTSVIINFMKNSQENKPLVICGDGSQSMDFINIHDVVEANILAAQSDVRGEVFNVGSGTSTSVKQLAEATIKLFNKDLEIVYRKELNIIVRRRQADISKIKKLLGFRPKIGLNEGLAEIAKDIQVHPENY